MQHHISISASDLFGLVPRQIWSNKCTSHKLPARSDFTQVEFFPDALPTEWGTRAIGNFYYALEMNIWYSFHYFRATGHAMASYDSTGNGANKPKSRKSRQSKCRFTDAASGVEFGCLSAELQGIDKPNTSPPSFSSPPLFSLDRV